MTTKLTYIKTNGYNMVIAADENGMSYLTENKHFPTEGNEKEFLESIEDTSVFENDVEAEELLKIMEENEVIAEIEKDI